MPTTLTAIANEESLKGRLVAAGQFLQCIALAQQDDYARGPYQLFAQRHPASLYREHVIKAVVPGAGLGSAHTSVLAPSELASAIATYSDALSVYGRFRALAAPAIFGINSGEAALGGAVSWIADGKPITISSFQFQNVTLRPLPIAALAAVTEDLVRFATPTAATRIASLVARTMGDALDRAMFSTGAGVANVQPAGLYHVSMGSPVLAASGITGLAAAADLIDLLAEARERDMRLGSCVLVMNSVVCAALASFGSPFEGLGVRGGTLWDLPTLASETIDPTIIACIDASRVFVADSGEVQADTSRETNLQLSDAPTMHAITGSAATSVSLFQTNTVAFRAVRVCNWSALDSSVIYLSGVNYQQAGSPS